VDWITLLIELIGFVLLLMFIIVPIQEFRGILRKVKTRNVSLVKPPGRGFDVGDVGDRGEPRR